MTTQHRQRPVYAGTIEHLKGATTRAPASVGNIVFVAVGGPGASGKANLVSLIGNTLDAEVIRLNDFSKQFDRRWCSAVFSKTIESYSLLRLQALDLLVLVLYQADLPISGDISVFAWEALFVVEERT